MLGYTLTKQKLVCRMYDSRCCSFNQKCPPVPEHAVLGIPLSTAHRTQMWISARFVTEHTPRQLSKNVRLHSTPLVVLHLFQSFSSADRPGLRVLTTHALHLQNAINTGKKRAAGLHSKH